jgi:FkbM family methyltransferase
MDSQSLFRGVVGALFLLHIDWRRNEGRNLHEAAPGISVNNNVGIRPVTDLAISSKNVNPIYRLIDIALKTVLRLLPVSPLTERIALWWGYRFRPAPGVVKLRSGALMRTTHVDHLQLLLYYLGSFEPHAIDVMRQHLKPGSTVLDVGANIGLFSIEGAKAVGPSGNVIAIEAAPSHASSVRGSASLNKLTNVEVVSVAVGDANGEATLTLPRDTNFGMFTLGKVEGDESFKVPVRRIDDIVGGRRIDFIKMDIEGSEYQALLGAKETLKSRPPILIELNEAALNGCGSSSSQVKQLLASAGYTGRIVGSSADITIDQAHVCDECLFTATRPALAT